MTPTEKLEALIELRKSMLLNNVDNSALFNDRCKLFFRTEAPALLAEIEALRAENEKLKAAARDVLGSPFAKNYRLIWPFKQLEEAATGVEFKIDHSLPPGQCELRDNKGNVLARITDVV